MTIKIEKPKNSKASQMKKSAKKESRDEHYLIVGIESSCSCKTMTITGRTDFLRTLTLALSSCSWDREGEVVWLDRRRPAVDMDKKRQNPTIHICRTINTRSRPNISIRPTFPVNDRLSLLETDKD
ncbi:hypothetical protein QVD17_27788 [Tagetes erecta]|uniref:Uncharacterized protein n=1 Tax=Tagetes erecta TaxID=13708 RepID=A0AAD8KBN6_TARER|nr:hypothetical protein QVD17_27788 [Tagetes erecta]